jgi:hypothetical protein
VTERDPVVKDETFAPPAALGFRNVLQISEYAALEMIHLGETARQQVAAGLFAPYSAGTEHCDPAVPGWIELACGEILELPKVFDAGVEGAGECAHGDLERVSGIDQQRIRAGYQAIPFGRIDIDADLPRWIGVPIAQRDDFLFQPDFQPPEWHLRGMGEFQLEIVEPVSEQHAAFQFCHQCRDRARVARHSAVDAFLGQQHAALQFKTGAKRA